MSGTADEAFVEFVRARGASLMRYGYLLSGNEADAADLLQDALIGLRTGKVGTYGTEQASKDSFRVDPEHPLAWWPAQDDPDRLMVFDPARIR